MEDSNKLHEETLKIAKSLIERDPALKDWVTEKFPELKESEDERIRKLITNGLKLHGEEIFTEGELYKIFHWLEKKGEQNPIDKVESKFKAGDFITDGKRIFQIKETVWERNNRNDGSTYCESLIVNLRDGITYADNTDLKEYHLWTIQDAKDGDVLSFDNECSNYHSIGIFKRISSKNEPNGNTYRCYVRYGGFKEELEIPINGGELHHCGTSAHPATEEQRENLFKAMNEAGYEWDAEKKELKKIEQNPVWSEEDEQMFNDILLDMADRREMFKFKVEPKFKVGDTIVEKDLDEYDYETIKDIKNGQYIFTDGYCMNIDEQDGWQLVKTPTIIEQKPAWSEEDEDIYARIILRYTDYEGLIIRTKEESVANKMLDAMTQEENWIKSLKERYTWKPSEEQMKTLRFAANDYVMGETKNNLESLYNELKNI